MAVFWVVAPCSLVKFIKVSEQLAASITSTIIEAMMEAASTSETLVNHQITRRYNSEDSSRHENLKSYKKVFASFNS
jgi:hypothetical protein